MANNMMKNLEEQLRDFSELMGGRISAEDNRDYILGFILYKYLSEKQYHFANDQLKDDAVTDYIKLSDKKTLKTIQKKSIINLGFWLKPNNLFSVIVDKGLTQTEEENYILDDLQTAFNQIEESARNTETEDDFKNLFQQLNLKSIKLGHSKMARNEIIVQMLGYLSKIEFKTEDNSGSLSTTYEYLIEKFATGLSLNFKEFYTNKNVSDLIAKIVKCNNSSAKTIYDPTCGSGSLLLRVGRGLNNPILLGQELNTTAHDLVRMNMLVHDVHPLNFDIQLGDVLNDPKHIDSKFDVIVSNPPMGLKRKVNNLESDQRFNQFGIGLPKISLDFAFILHMLYHLEEDGIMITIVPNGVLFRGGLEERVRKHLIGENLIDSIISLPANLLHNTGIPVSLFICRKNRKPNQDILFIDASGEEHFERNRYKNILRDTDIDLITETFKQRKSKSHYSRLVTHKEIQDNEFNLNVTRYVDSSDAAKEIEYLAEQFGEFEFLRLEKVIKSIKPVRKKHIFLNSQNVIYFPRQAILKVKSREDIKDVKTKTNYFEIEFNESMILSDYVVYFFESDLGQNILKTKSNASIIQSISKDDLLNTIKIPVPSLSIQKQVISAYKLMSRVKESITKIQKELSLSPNTANSVSEKLHGTLESLNELSEEESILAEIRKGESRTLEFKESFSLDVRQYQNNKKYSPKKEKHIEHSSLKNVAD